MTDRPVLDNEAYGVSASLRKEIALMLGAWEREEVDESADEFAVQIILAVNRRSPE